MSTNNNPHHQVHNWQNHSDKTVQPNPKDPNDALSKIIVDGDAKTLVEQASQIGKNLAQEKLSTSQIRAIFGEVRKLQGQLSIQEQNENALRKLYLLKPKMAYRKEKEKGQGVKRLVDILDPALSLVFKDPDKREERFEYFVEFFEAILAYHRANGGKTN